MPISHTLWGGMVSAAIFMPVIAAPAQAAPVAVTGDPVLFWHEQMLSTIAGSPTATSRSFAMASVALHDAANATLGNTNFNYLKVPNQGGDTRAATSVAARNVLVSLYPGQTAALNAALASSLALVPDGAAKTAGMATGAAMAAAVIANRTGDGATAVVPYTPSGLPGRWAPTPPGFANASLPQWATVDPWLMASPESFRPGAPPTLASAEYTAAFNEVKDIGGVGSLLRTADQSASAVFWAGAAGTGPWIRTAIDAAVADGKTTLESASILARLSVSLADAAVAIWDVKYQTDYWRPVTAIRGADTDGNPGTIADAGWTPFITTPPHPSYVSGHSAVAGAAASILGDAFGAGDPFCLTWGGNSRCWSNFALSAEDAALSRLWGGIHWRFDNEAGLALGQQIAGFTLEQSAFGAVPEPESWALLIVGFGWVGAAMRRRKAASA